METKSGLRGSGWRAGLAGLAALGLYTALTLLYLRPAGVWRNHIAPVPEDSVFNLYVLKWGAHQIRLGMPHFWDANIFYPTRGTLAFSDHLLGPAAQLALFELAVPNAIAGYNALFVSSFVASALAMAWVARRGGRSAWAAVFAGWAFAFSPFRLQHLNHIQMLIAQWIPLTLWSWDRLLAERKPGDAVRFLLFYLLHVTGGCYLAYMIHVPMLILLANRLAVHGRGLLSRRALAVVAPAALAGLAVTAALFLPYVRVARGLGLSRDATEIGVMGATVASYVSPSTESLYFDPPKPRALSRKPAGGLAQPFYRSENALFAGFLPTLLCLLGLASSWRSGRREPEGRPKASPGQRAVLAGLLGLAVLAWAWGDLLTLTPPESRAVAAGWSGPALLLVVLVVALGAWAALRRRWIGPFRPPAGDPWERGLALSGLVCLALTFPIVYVPLSRVVPGLDGMRVPARFYAFVSLSVAWFAARGADRLLDGLRTAGRERSRAALGAALVAVLALELAPKRVHWVPMLREEEFPPVYHWIARQRDVRALVELPIRKNWRENVPMYYSTLHWRPIANGYSGYEPAIHRELAARIGAVPDRAGVEMLRGLGISHILIHQTDLAHRVRGGLRLLDRFERTLAHGAERQVEPVWRGPAVRVYRILPSPPVFRPLVIRVSTRGA